MKVAVLILLGIVFNGYGGYSLLRIFKAKVPYSLKSDMQHTFFKLHLRYLNHFNVDDNRPLRVVPILVFSLGLVLLIMGVVRFWIV